MLPPAFVAVSVTVYLPETAYTCAGFSSVLVELSPKSQDHEAGVLVEVSVKFTVSPATGADGEKVKAAMGADAAGLIE